MAAFTLVEILLVLMILAMLFAIIIPNFLNARFRAELSACEENESGISKGLEIYYTQNQSYPTTLDTSFYTNFIGKNPTCPLGGNNYGYVVEPTTQTYTVSCSAPHYEVNTGIATGYPQYSLVLGGLQTGP
jgi:type II secretory pathway pseudopilin PulG